MKPFETERLHIRPLEAGDLEALHALYRLPEVMRYITGEPRDLEATKAALARHLEDHRIHGYGLCAAIHKSEGKLIGRCGLIPWRAEGPWQAEVAWLFAPAWWGSGLGTEFGHEMLRKAWDPLGLGSVVARAYKANVGSIRIMEKLGMSWVKATAEEVYYEASNPLGGPFE